MENGLQVAFMAPTEILAEQHFRNLQRLLGHSRHRVALVCAGRGGA
jgi:RecG-like helicase